MNSKIFHKLKFVVLLCLPLVMLNTSFGAEEGEVLFPPGAVMCHGKKVDTCQMIWLASTKPNTALKVAPSGDLEEGIYSFVKGTTEGLMHPTYFKYKNNQSGKQLTLEAANGMVYADFGRPGTWQSTSSQPNNDDWECLSATQCPFKQGYPSLKKSKPTGDES